MMKQPIWKLSACAFALLLNACASNKAYENLPINATGSISESSNTTSTNLSGIAIKRTQQNNQPGKIATPRPITFSGSNYRVVVDGHPINLLSTSSDTQYINNTYSHMRFGAYNAASQNNFNHAYAIVYGDVTPTNRVPTEGTATYQGDAIVNPTSGNSANAIPAKSSFAVDYGRKSITGIITGGTNGAINLSGNISGNSFEGNRNGFQMNGRFFGPNAEELGGTFNSTNSSNSIMGTFGAQKR